MNDVRLSAARARARGSVLAEERSRLASLEPSLWRVAQTENDMCLTFAEDLQFHSADIAGLSMSRLSEGQARVLLALLVVTRPATSNHVHPYPGVIATVNDVLTVLGAPRLGAPGEAHAKGALKKLHSWRLAHLGDVGEPVQVEVGTPVRLGPAVALWSGPWLGELLVLVDRVAEQRGWDPCL